MDPRPPKFWRTAHWDCGCGAGRSEEEEEELAPPALPCNHKFERMAWREDGITYSYVRCRLCLRRVRASELCRCLLCGLAVCSTCVLERAIEDPTDPNIIVPEES